MGLSTMIYNVYHSRIQAANYILLLTQEICKRLTDKEVKKTSFSPMPNRKPLYKPLRDCTLTLGVHLFRMSFGASVFAYSFEHLVLLY